MNLTTLPTHSREFVELCLSRKVDFVLVGGFALAAHGYARFTEDVDLLIATNLENAQKLAGVVREFGFGALGFTAEDFLEPEQVFQLGRPPQRIDILTSISGVEWEEIWATKEPLALDGLSLWVISLEKILTNKRSSGRPKDLLDVLELERRRAK